MKAIGAEIKAFYDEWPPGKDWYLDDAELEVYTDEAKGELQIELDKKYDVDAFGTICWQGPDERAPSKDDRYVSFGAFFRKWRKGRTCHVVSVEVSNASYDAFLSTCNTNGWKVST